jgi:hypothetical protein
VECLVEAACQGARGALHVQTQAGIAHLKRARVWQFSLLGSAG